MTVSFFMGVTRLFSATMGDTLLWNRFGEQAAQVLLAMIFVWGHPLGLDCQTQAITAGLPNPTEAVPETKTKVTDEYP